MENCSILTSIACGCDASTPVITAVSSTLAPTKTLKPKLSISAAPMLLSCLCFFRAPVLSCLFLPIYLTIRAFFWQVQWILSRSMCSCCSPLGPMTPAIFCSCLLLFAPGCCHLSPQSKPQLLFWHCPWAWHPSEPDSQWQPVTASPSQVQLWLLHDFLWI